MRRHHRGIDNRPPNYPFELSRVSPQARGLIFLLPIGVNQLSASLPLVDRIAGKVGSFSGHADYRIIPELGNGYYFDGTGDYISFASQDILNPTHVSLSAWAYSISNANQPCMAGKAAGTEATDRQYLMDMASSERLYWRIYDSEGDVTQALEANGLPTGSWQLILGTWDGTNALLYRNGVQVASASDARTLNSTAGVLEFGRFPTYNGQYWNGYLTDLRVYNRGLSANEAWQMYDPATRWDLYLPVRRIWATVEVAAGVAPTGVLYGPLMGPLGGPI